MKQLVRSLMHNDDCRHFGIEDVEPLNPYLWREGGGSGVCLHSREVGDVEEGVKVEVGLSIHVEALPVWLRQLPLLH